MLCSYKVCEKLLKIKKLVLDPESDIKVKWKFRKFFYMVYPYITIYSHVGL